MSNSVDKFGTKSELLCQDKRSNWSLLPDIIVDFFFKDTIQWCCKEEKKQVHDIKIYEYIATF